MRYGSQGPEFDDNTGVIAALIIAVIVAVTLVVLGASPPPLM